MVISAKPFDPCIPYLWSGFFEMLCQRSSVFFLADLWCCSRTFVALNFRDSSNPSTWAVSNFPWLITEPLCDLIASNATLSLVKILLLVLLIQLATSRTVICFSLSLLCRCSFFHLLEAIFPQSLLCFSLSVFLLHAHTLQVIVVIVIGTHGFAGGLSAHSVLRG